MKPPSARDLFARALELDPDDRDSFLAAECGENAELRLEVQRLLVDSEKAQSFFSDEDGATIGMEEFDDTFTEAEGDVVGPYTLRQQIGEGGFGTVWMAEQSVPISRMVALKVIKAGMDTKQVLARFEAERQAVAMMDHPNIAKVLDAGATPAGRPYFAMELVKGMPITEFCDQQKFGPRRRLELFRDVCAAVQHAHQKGIIHRDLKPSNIMVTLAADVPVVKVIDFGIAKATQNKLTEKTLFTRFEQFLGTPVYMSPEQAAMSAIDIDTRSDIYSLGVLLYELLAGAPPFDQKSLLSAGYDEMRRIIAEDEPPKPSTRCTETQIQASTATGTGSKPKKFHISASALKGELDWIVMKAIEKDRTRRYETANAFVADIERYLDDKPVEAAAPSTTYKLKKFARRNRTAVAFATTVTVLLIAGIFGTSWFAMSSQEARIDERRAKEEALRSGEETKKALERTKVALNQSRYEEAKTWLERARLAIMQKNKFAAAMMAAKGLGFRGFGVERQTEEFRKANPVLLEKEKPEFEELMQIAMDGNVPCRPIWRSPLGSHKERVSTVTFSPDGTTLASGSWDKTIKLWSVLTGKEIRTFGHQDGVMSVAFSPDGTTLASGSDDKTIRLWDLSSGKEIRTFEGHQDGIFSVAFSPDGSTLASGSADKTIKLWDLSSGKEIHTFEGHQDPVVCVAFSPDGSILASGSWDKTIRLWDLSTRKEILTFGHQNLVMSVAFSPDGTTLASGSADGTIKLWDLSTRKEIHTFKGHQRNFLCMAFGLAFSPDGTTLASGSDDKTIKLWEVSSGKEIHTYEGYGLKVGSVAFRRGGTILPGGSRDKTIKLWEISTGKEIHTSGHQHRILSVAFSPDGTTLASGSRDKTIKLWDVSSGKEIHTFEGHKHGIFSVAFSPNGTTLASGSDDKTIKLWNVPSGKEIRTFEGHQGRVMSVAFSPDGATLASRSDDKTIKLWEVSSGKEIRTLRHQDTVMSVAFSPDGTTLASRSYDKTIKLWNADNSPPDLAGYLDPRNPWYRLEGSGISLNSQAGDRLVDREPQFLNVSPVSHVGILHSTRSPEEKNRDLFWNYLHAGNWNSAGVLYARLTDPASKESAREMTVLKRAAKAQSAFDGGLYHHARWHLGEITPLFKPDETDPAMLRAKELMKRLKDDLDKHKTSGGRENEPK